MAADKKQYIYKKGTDEALDAEFSAAAAYAKVRVGESVLFWKSGLRWYAIKLDSVQRIFRRVETVYGKLCCGGQTFIIEWLVLILGDGAEMVLHIGDNEQKKAEGLMLALKAAHPEIAYGKV